MLNFADAGEPVSFDLIPDDTLAWVQIKVRPKNLAQNLVEKSNGKGSRWLDLELKVLGGPYKDRVLWDMVLTFHPEGKGVEGGAAACKAILECNGAHPDNKPSYSIPTYMHFDGLRAAIKIKIEKGEDYKDQQGKKVKGKDKNRVATWLSPYATSTQKAFAELMEDYGGQVPPTIQAPHEQAPPAGHPAFAAPPPNGPQDYGMPAYSPPAQTAPAQPPVHQAQTAPAWGTPAPGPNPGAAPPPVQHNGTLPWAANGSAPSTWGNR